MFALVIVSRSHLELEIFRQLQIQRQIGGENTREQGNKLSILIAICIRIWIVKIDTIVSLYYQLFVI